MRQPVKLHCAPARKLDRSVKTAGLIFKLIVGIVYNTALFAVLLLVPAHTCDWWRAWVFIGTVFVGTAATLAGRPARIIGGAGQDYRLLIEKKGKQPEQMELSLDYARAIARSPTRRAGPCA